jgi:phosphoglycolate phosphatase
MAWPRAVVFDLDGTLIDSAGDIADVLNDCLAEDGISALDEPSVVTMIGGGAKVLVERALGRLGRGNDTALFDRVSSKFASRYAALGAGRSVPFPGAVEVLEHLSSKGIELAICTNKPEQITQRVLEQLDLQRWFRAVIGETPRLRRKPAPDMLLAALSGLSVGPGDAVMVGDSAADIGTARAAGVRSIAVTFGYTTTPDRDLGADAVIDRLREVPAALDRLRPIRAE